MARISLIRTCLLIIFGLWATPCHSEIIFSNLAQPGDLYGPDSVGVGAIPVPGLFVYNATNFTPAFHSQLTSIVLPLTVVSGFPEIDVLLFSDSGNLPGALIESYQVTGFPPVGSALLTTMVSTLHPLLSSRQHCGVAVTGGSPTPFAFWSLTLFAGDPVAGGAEMIINNRSDLGWTRNPGTRVGAMIINGDPVPEPASVILLATSLAILGVSSKARRGVRGGGWSFIAGVRAPLRPFVFPGTAVRSDTTHSV